MKLDQTHVAVSAALSIALHGLLLLALASPLGQLLYTPARPLPELLQDSLVLHSWEPPSPQGTRISEAELKVPFTQTAAQVPRDIRATLHALTSQAVDAGIAMQNLEGLEQGLTATERLSQEMAPLPPQIYAIEPRPELSLSKANMSVAPERALTLAALSSSQGGKDAVTAPPERGGGGARGGGGPIDLPLSLNRPVLTAPPLPLLETAGSGVCFTPAPLPSLGPSQDSRAGQLDDVLVITPYIYVDRQDNAGYFRVDITLNQQSERLRSMPKDVLLLLDTSLSIKSDQLAEFTRAYQAALKALHPQDAFNVVSFDTLQRPLFAGCRKADDEARKLGREYLRSLRPEGRTDVYRALQPIIANGARRESRPQLVFLATDGNTTASGSLENSALIRSISAGNRAGTSIFALSNGDDINEFMLDLLTLRNRGGSMFRKEVPASGDAFRDFMLANSDIIVADLAYRFSDNIASAEVFPKDLPHLYRRGRLSLWGRFSPQDPAAIVRLHGQGAEGPEEIVFRIDFSRASTDNDLLAREWALRKIFHLFGQITDTTEKEERQRLLVEISTLGTRYRIPLPYDAVKD